MMPGEVDYLSQSDDDFANELPPVVEAVPGSEVAPVVETQPAAVVPETTPVVETPAAVDPAVAATATVTDPASASVVENTDEDDKPKMYVPGVDPAPANTATPAVPAVAEVDPNKPVVPDAEVPGQTAVVDFKAAYEQIMAPFKANGKTIELRNIEEAQALMKMGANYTRKMQDIAPHRKILLMLENNGLLDESKLSFYIDLEKKNPEAIKKLVAESGIDPLEIDTSVPAKYQASNHSVTEEELGFRTVLDDVCSTPEGQQTVSLINSTWDQASKEQLWREPGLMAVFHQQRENGIYARITSEVDRLKALGQIPMGTSFLNAYKLVGDHLHAKNAFADLTVNTPPTNQAVNTPAVPTPVAVKTVTPKAPVVNPAVAAASTPRSAPKRAQTIVNPLSVSDEDFMKTHEQFRNRV